MAFRFPLEVVFHFRQSMERQQELRLRAANQQVARVRHLLEQLDRRMEEMRACQSQQLGAGTTAAELRFALLCEGAFEQQRREKEQELVRLQALRDQQQRIFRQARRERETIESLRSRQLREYERNQARKEQRQLDDLFLLRQAYLRRG
jgi:flagellar export protein FliJ